MSTKDNGGPAFQTDDNHWKTADLYHYKGMTLRDYFATHASEQDVMAQGERIRDTLTRTGLVGVLPVGWRTTARYMHADEMLKERAK